MRKLNAEYISHTKMYRLYAPESPRQTVAYEDDLETAERNALENGYDGVVECGSNTTNVELY